MELSSVFSRLGVFFAGAMFVVCSVLPGCGGGSSGTADEPGWGAVKATTTVTLAMPTLFEQPRPLAISTLGWEDGLNVSRDGLHLYATYIPADFLSFVLSGDSVTALPAYDRGPHYDMDLESNPTGETFRWYHSDIIYASRLSATDPFSPWQTSGMKRPIYSEGGVSTLFSDAGTVEWALFTSNDGGGQTNLKVISNTHPALSGLGVVMDINTPYIEDNPHIDRIDSDTLILFFDSPDRPGGAGGHDLWYSLSTDNGASWRDPEPVSSVNTPGTEHQPHLYFDGADWWLYFSAYHSDGKLAIFRASQQQPADWNSWGTRELVLSAGSAAGIGEPTLTRDGDLYFVVVYENPEGADHDRFDADPWMAGARNTGGQ
ncbi:MAG: sialidase family protein [Ketobacteraceae bacterium]|nr:sialidase family protein [Ketobacteraceae bacterium]